jgi:dCMP deaminase
MSTSWDVYFIKLAQEVAKKSTDRSTKCGAVIVNEHHELVATGFNGFPRDIDDENPQYHERPLKYDITEHAERNAIYQAAAGRGGTRGCTLYLGHNPGFGICTDCARAIIQAGIKSIVGPERDKFEGKGELWKLNCITAQHMLTEVNIPIRTVLW